MTDQNRPRPGTRRKFPFLSVLGALLLAFSVCGLYLSVPDLLQYAFLPERNADSASRASDPTGAEKTASAESDSAAGSALSRFRRLTDPALWAGEDIPMTIQGSATGLSVSREEKSSSISDLTVIQAGPRYGEVFPREMKEGVFLSPAETEAAAASAVLDSALSFRLFGEFSPLGQTVLLDGHAFTVIGVASHARSLGSSTEYTLWIPLGSLEADMDLITVSARAGTGGDSMASLWKSKARELLGEGTFLHLSHEKTGASLLPRLLLIVLALVLLKKWIAFLRHLGAAFRREAREKISRSYPSRLIGYFALRVLLALLLLALTLAACWGLAAFAVQPLEAFPDWIPENPADFASWGARFRSLVAANAAPVRLVTEEAATLQFWHFLIRLGTVLLLIGLLLRSLRQRKPKDS